MAGYTIAAILTIVTFDRYLILAFHFKPIIRVWKRREAVEAGWEAADKSSVGRTSRGGGQALQQPSNRGHYFQARGKRTVKAK